MNAALEQAAEERAFSRLSEVTGIRDSIAPLFRRRVAQLAAHIRATPIQQGF